jgi:hypothetical protein
MTNVATIITRLTSELSQSRLDMDTATLNRRNELWTKLLARLEAFATEERAILANRTLSDEGKQEQLAKRAEAVLADAAWFRQVLKDNESAHARLTTLLFTVESPVKDERLRYDRAREIRDRMAGLNPAERDTAYVLASERGQAEVLLALQDAPGGSWVSPDIRERADIERAKQAQPDVYETYRQNEILHEHLHGMAEHLSLMMQSYGAPPAKVATGLGLAA